MLRYVIVVLVLCINFPAYSLTFSSPPRESRAAGNEFYQPLAKYLSMVLGEEVTYKHPSSWLYYQRSIKRDEYDIVFDGPHLASWRMKHYDHKPVMMLPGNLIFYFIAKKDNSYVNNTKDLAAKKVCVLPPPNLNALVLLETLEGPAREPIIKGIKGGLKAVVKSLISEKCVGAVLPAGFYNKKLSDAQRNQLKIIYKSVPLPNQAITVSKRVSVKQRQQIINALSTEQGLKIINGFGKRFGGGFIPAQGEKYNGASQLLEGSILGWQGKKNKNIKSSVSGTGSK